MNLGTFLKHHNIETNPFRDEEARHDEVFARLRDDAFEHPEAGKIIGDLKQPSSSIVFGEKGSGKTAIRLQIEEAIARHNLQYPDRRVLAIAYDDLDPVLDRFCRHENRKDPAKALADLTLGDHIDGILSVAVPALVDAAINPPDGSSTTSSDSAIPRFTSLDAATLKRLDPTTKRDWLLLQALYDRPEHSIERGRKLRRRLRVWKVSRVRPLRWLCALLWGIALMALLWYAYLARPQPEWGLLVAVIALMAMALLTSTVVIGDLIRVVRVSRRLAEHLRTVDRPVASFRTALERLPASVLAATRLPVDDLDDARFEMLGRLQRAVRPFGYTEIVILMDSVDEPMLVRGDADRMRWVVWPLLNNKFLQQPHCAIKMMLPIELRYSLYGQSKDFFQVARLDKQNMVDRLEWSGITLYDLCNRRIAACTNQGVAPARLPDLFAPDVPRDDLVRALDQMRQPRDAFKLLYRVIQRHCQGVSEEEEAWRIDRHILESVLDQQKERVDALRGGLGPA